MRSVAHEKSRAGQSAAHTTGESCVNADRLHLVGSQQFFDTPTDAARRVLRAAWSGETTVSAKAGQFLGQVSVGGGPLSDKQAGWLDTLLARAGLASLESGGEQHV